MAHSSAVIAALAITADLPDYAPRSVRNIATEIQGCEAYIAVCRDEGQDDCANQAQGWLSKLLDELLDVVGATTPRMGVLAV